MSDTVTLPARPIMVRVARSAVRALLDGSPRIEDAVLIASELVTNSIRYSRSRHGGYLDILMDRTEGWARIEVVDDGSDAPPIPPEAADEHGRGLIVVRCLADKWSHDVYRDRTVWWAELTWPEPPASRPERP